MSKKSHADNDLWGAIKWVAIIVLILGTVFGVGYLAKQSRPSSRPVAIDAIEADDHVKGNRDSKVVVVEYSDFQCPACASYFPLAKAVSEKYGDQIAFVYRHFPLRSIHQHAENAARATEAAGKQDKFWEMHDMIFDTQSVWSTEADVSSVFEGYARDLGLDLDQYKQDVASSDVRDKVNRDYNSGNKSGVQGTPTFFLNGQRIAPRSLEEFSQLIDAALKNA